jgi:hypothetical protein
VRTFALLIEETLSLEELRKRESPSGNDIVDLVTSSTFFAPSVR